MKCSITLADLHSYLWLTMITIGYLMDFYLTLNFLGIF